MKIKTILDPIMESALNDQANAELWSGYLYLSMSYDMDHKGFEGISKWFEKQAGEEFEHATKILKYINSRDGQVKLKPIAEVRQEWNSPTDAFEDTLMHEKFVTEKIHELMELALEMKDYATQRLLQWFIEEQIEEEDTPRKYLETLKKIEKDPAALYMFSKELGNRED